MAPVIQSYKKVINVAPASYTAGANNIFAITGVDAVAAGQTSATDVNVPTGAIVKYIEFQQTIINLSPSAAFIHVAIQYRENAQASVNANVVGGNPQRNQVLHQTLFGIGEDQNNARVYRFKVPKKFQRIREGRSWILAWQTSETVSMAAQVIYKFYR